MVFARHARKKANKKSEMYPRTDRIKQKNVENKNKKYRKR